MTDREALTRGTRRSALWGVALIVFMGGLSFAAVPLYDWVCRVTGFGGVTQRADAAPATATDREIQVRFDSSVARDLPWSFAPTENAVRLKIGENRLAFYRAENLSDRPITGTATFNVTPFEAGAYFSKIACFCFEEQTLQPGESVEMPVSFFVDPEILENEETRDLSVITLSYTFFEAQRTTRTEDDVATR